MKEDKIKEEVSRRTSQEKNSLRIRRIITMIVSLIVIVAGWAAIVVSAIYSNYLTKEIGKVSAVLGNWVPTLIITAVNIVIGELLAKITDLEKWEYSSL
jgi:hypothetical protein